MYICINCGAECKELFRRYCPSVLKILKCVSEIKSEKVNLLAYVAYIAQLCIISGEMWIVS